MILKHPTLPIRVSDAGKIYWQDITGAYGEKGKWIEKRQQPREKGYMRVVIRVGQRQQDFRVHKLVLETFVGPCPEESSVRTETVIPRITP